MLSDAPLRITKQKTLSLKRSIYRIGIETADGSRNRLRFSCETRKIPDYEEMQEFQSRIISLMSTK